MTHSRFSLFLLLVILPLFLGFSEKSFQRVQFDIKPSSKLYLNGTSNINEFTCDCENYTHSGTVSINESKQGNWIFEYARLSIAVAAFDCGHSGINRDMGKALRSDKYPKIGITLKEIVNNASLRNFTSGTEHSLHVVVDISLAGATREYPLQVKVRKIKPELFKITAQKKLFMSDFGVAPPTALFGLIKVNDIINISFDLEISTIVR